MSNRRWDLVVSSKRKNSDKFNSTKVGAVFEKDDGRLSIALDPGIAISALDGVFITAFVPKPRDGQRQGGGNTQPEWGGADESDNVPF